MARFRVFAPVFMQFGVKAFIGILFVCLLANPVLAITEPSWWQNEYVVLNGKNTLSQKQIDWCFSNLNNKQDSEIAPLNTGVMTQIINDCTNPELKGPCSIEYLDKNDPSKGTKLVCDKTRTSKLDPLDSAILVAKINEAVPLVQLLCGEAQTDSQLQARAQCAKAVRTAYYSPRCYYHNGRDYIDGPTTSEFAAQCINQALSGKNIPGLQKATVAEMIKAISEGRAKSQEAIDAAAKDKVNKGSCEKSGGTWKNGGCEETKSSCNIDGIGWIVCPVMTFIAKANDMAYGFLSDNFLKIDIELLKDNDTKTAWQSFRDIANVAFILAFLIIIYSQMTGAGVTNYGIKKLLPKLIIAAVLVNVSYIVCQLAVDISNIVGNSIVKLFDSVSTAAKGADTGGAGYGLWEDAVTLLLAASVSVGLIAAVVVAPSSLLAFAVVLMILLARKALVILLIVISPLAFVAYLLPNTEQWFKKWWKMFSGMLFVYPMIGVVFGASSMAGKIINNAASSQTGDDSWLLQLVGLGVTAIPLFVVPGLLKGAMSAAGAIGAKLSNLSDKTNSFAKNRAMKGRLGEAKAAFDTRRQNRRVKRRAGEGRFGRINRAIDSSRFGKYIGGDKGAAAAASAIAERNEKEISNQSGVLTDHVSRMDDPTATAHLVSTYNKAVESGDTIAARAAARTLVSRGGGGVAALREATSKLHDDGKLGADSKIDVGDLRHEIKKHGDGVKGKDKRLMDWAEGKTADVKTTKYTDTSDTIIATQNVDAITAGIASGEISDETAYRLLNSNVSDLIKSDAVRAALKAHSATYTPPTP